MAALKKKERKDTAISTLIGSGVQIMAICRSNQLCLLVAVISPGV